MNKRVEIQEPIITEDLHGGMGDPAWNTVATRWASIEPLRGREYIEAQQMQAQATVRVRMRPYAGLTEKHRLVWNEG